VPTIATLKTERSLREVAERVYGTLDADKLARAQTALLKANPHLKVGAALQPGAVVTVPELPGLKPRPGVVRSDPVEELRNQLIIATESLQVQMAERLDARSQEFSHQVELLKSKEVAAAIKRDPAGTDLAKAVTLRLREQAKSIGEERKRNADLFRRIATDLKKLDLG
jgi:hypothetical protein